MDVGSWLRSLGLGQYEAQFPRQRDRCGRTAAADGRRPQGHRRLRCRRSAHGCSPQSPLCLAQRPSVNAPASPPKSAPVEGLRISAERRPITVMFCDLVGSTSLAAKLDAEDWRNLVNAYLDEASKAVTGFGGHVLKKLGDGLMALFGYPQAQENDAERAVRAALAIQRALADLNARNAANGRAGACPPASASRPARSWSTRPARCSVTRRTSRRASKLLLSQGRSWSREACSARWPGSSSSRRRARTS